MALNNLCYLATVRGHPEEALILAAESAELLLQAGMEGSLGAVVPTLTEWGLVLIAVVMLSVAVYILRRRSGQTLR